MTDSVTYSINEKIICKTAPATPGRLNIYEEKYYKKFTILADLLNVKVFTPMNSSGLTTTTWPTPSLLA